MVRFLSVITVRGSSYALDGRSLQKTSARKAAKPQRKTPRFLCSSFAPLRLCERWSFQEQASIIRTHLAEFAHAVLPRLRRRDPVPPALAAGAVAAPCPQRQVGPGAAPDGVLPVGSRPETARLHLCRRVRPP